MTHPGPIPRLDARALDARAPAELAALHRAVTETGFLTLHSTAITPAQVAELIGAYRSFFALPETEKRRIDMARTGANRGWGGPRSERVDPASNPDYKEVFDCGFELPPGDPWRARGLSVYADNLWPEGLPAFRKTVERYQRDALAVSLRLLRAIARVLGAGEDHFANKFTRPMALLRANHYPPRPTGAGPRDFGIGAHTDYGCLTLLATDGVPGLEVMVPGGEWVPVAAPPGEFIVNFGEMLEMWSGGRVRATPHRVVGGAEERISVPLFVNPDWDANVAPTGSGKVIHAGPHLEKRFAETYLHLGAG
ncbi:isopenicillin N synthase family dioxygenase [Rhodosalinus sp.]|uniref:isopenicillin N synthase family dioxygenase n=1 Tax=Rhodosalinus sp. TaxID=2047741 RepID=UPI00397B7370